MASWDAAAGVSSGEPLREQVQRIQATAAEAALEVFEELRAVAAAADVDRSCGGLSAHGIDGAKLDAHAAAVAAGASAGVKSAEGAVTAFEAWWANCSQEAKAGQLADGQAQSTRLTSSTGVQEHASNLLRSLHDIAWSQLHGDSARAARLAAASEASEAQLRPWREILAMACLMQCALHLASLCSRLHDQHAENDLGPKALRLLDVALIVAGPDAFAAPALFSAVSSLSAVLAGVSCPPMDDGMQPASKRPRCNAATDGCATSKFVPSAPLTGGLLARAPATVPAVRRPVRELPQGKTLGIEEFLLGDLADRSPVVVRGGCAAWPGVRRWADEAFWQDSAIGQRFVPVEMDYWMDSGYKMMSIRDFVAHCKSAGRTSEVAPGLSGGGYIAQHALLDLIPALEADVMTPDIAHCGSEGYLLRQVFFGPRGTVTPLHFDPYENAFCQIVGSKYMRLYAPSEAHCLYPRGAGDALQNNSRIEPADLLEGEASGAYGALGAQGQVAESFPKLLEADYVDVVLEPGDLLYLPKGWWHYVKSLSTSISVAFHFN